MRTLIEPLDTAGTRARLIVDWQNTRPVAGRPEITSPRIDIGVFANNGAHDSAPAFISILMPDHERRVYEETPEGEPKPMMIDRRKEQYADPVIHPQIAWRDVYRYGPSGQFIGWTRYSKNGEQLFDADGRWIAESGPIAVRYELQQIPEPTVLAVTPSERN